MSLDTFLAGFLGSNTVEILAALSGFICLLLLIKASIWNFAFGFIQVTLYVWVFYQAKLYSDAGLHVVYMALQIYGWWNWSRNLHDGQEVQVQTMRVNSLLSWTALALLSSAALGSFMYVNTDASLPFPDAFTTCTSLIAFILMTQRYTVNWVFWIAVDLVAIAVYFHKGLYPTMILYCCFLVMAIIGLSAWSKKCKEASTRVRIRQES